MRAPPPCGVCTQPGTCTHTSTPHLPRPPAGAQPLRVSQARSGEGRASRGTRSRATADSEARWPLPPSQPLPARALARVQCDAASCLYSLGAELGPFPPERSQDRPRPRALQQCPARLRQWRWEPRVSRHLPRARPLAAAHLPQGGGRGAGRGTAGGEKEPAVGSKNRTGASAGPSRRSSPPPRPSPPPRRCLPRLRPLAESSASHERLHPRGS